MNGAATSVEAQCRDDAMDATLREEQEAWMAIEQLRQHLAADAEGIDALLPLLSLGLP